ncbi:hypothetical protein EV368DRAFT_90139 [Lentinula lateritia]|nr:hypothetical protein EV368DRAFT_90139 [Lentinula lateritia]
MTFVISSAAVLASTDTVIEQCGFRTSGAAVRTYEFAIEFRWNSSPPSLIRKGLNETIGALHQHKLFYSLIYVFESLSTLHFCVVLC